MTTTTKKLEPKTTTRVSAESNGKLICEIELRYYGRPRSKKDKAELRRVLLQLAEDETGEGSGNDTI